MIFPPFWILKVADRNGRDNYANRMFVHMWQKILEVFSIESPMEKKNDSLEIIITSWNGTGAARYNEDCSRMIKILLKRTPS